MLLVVFAMTMIFAAGNGHGVAVPSTPLFAGIPARATHAERQAALTERLEQKFKVGRPEAGLEAYLKSQGFKTKRLTSSLAPGQPIYGEARMKYGPGLCQMIADVHWRADPTGLLSELNVEHTADFCIG